MLRRTFLGSSLALPFVGGMPRHEDITLRTRWRLTQSEGLDAVLFLGPLSEAPLYSAFYGADVQAFKKQFKPEVLEALRSLAEDAAAQGKLLGPTLALLSSGGPDQSIEAAVAALQAPETLLRPRFLTSAYAVPGAWERLTEWAPRAAIVLDGLQEAGFADWRRGRLSPLIERRRPVLLNALGGLDVIGEQERLLGRNLDQEIEVCLALCVAPHAVKVQGQRFVVHAGYPESLIVLSASHEILHPPLPSGSPAMSALLDVLRPDPLISRIVRDHNPSFGYNSLEGLVEEDLVQALDQIVQERLGVVDKPPQARWRLADAGMHVLAAGFYGLMQRFGYAQTGGVLSDWLEGSVINGRLSGARLNQEASRILGFDVNDWAPTGWPAARAAAVSGTPA